MNERLQAIPWKWIALLILLTGISGCKRGMPRGEGVWGVVIAAGQSIENGEYRMYLLYQSAEYVIARELNRGARPVEAESMARRFADGIFVAMSVFPRELTGTPEDIRKDLLNASLQEGEARFRQKLAYLQNGLREKVRLEDAQGRTIPLTTYSFSRSFGIGTSNTFLFAFPSRYQGRKIDIDDLVLVIEDFGWNAGVVRARLKSPGSLTLRVPNE
jgi:hypothetical protein